LIFLTTILFSESTVDEALDYIQNMWNLMQRLHKKADQTTWKDNGASDEEPPINLKEVERGIFGRLRLHMISSPPVFFGIVFIFLAILIFLLIFLGMSIRLCQISCPMAKKCVKSKRNGKSKEDQSIKFGLSEVAKKDENELLNSGPRLVERRGVQLPSLDFSVLRTRPTFTFPPKEAPPTEAPPAKPVDE